jgi:hypothetical protein
MATWVGLKPAITYELGMRTPINSHEQVYFIDVYDADGRWNTTLSTHFRTRLEMKKYLWRLREKHVSVRKHVRKEA